MINFTTVVRIKYVRFGTRNKISGLTKVNFTSTILTTVVNESITESQFSQNSSTFLGPQIYGKILVDFLKVDFLRQIMRTNILFFDQIMIIFTTAVRRVEVRFG